MKSVEAILRNWRGSCVTTECTIAQVAAEIDDAYQQYHSLTIEQAALLHAREKETDASIQR